MLHRLNRAEYANAIRDLLALDVDVAALLPADDSAYGFDNISDVLGVSPSLQERYLSAAADDQRAGGRRLRRARRSPRPTAFARTCRRTSTSKACRSGRSAALAIRHAFPLDGEYDVQVRLFRRPTSATCAASTIRTRSRLSARRRAVHLATIGGNADLAPMFEQAAERRRRDRGAAWPSACRVKAGPHAGGGRVRSRTFRSATRRRLQPFLRSSVDTLDWTGLPHHPVADDHRAVRRHRSRRHAEPASHLRVPADRGRRPELACARQISRRSPAARIGSRSPSADLTAAARVSIRQAGAKGRSRPASSGAAAILASPRVRLPRRARSRRRRRPARVYRDQRSRAGVAPVVLPVEQHPGRRTAGRREPRAAARAGGARAAGAPDAGRLGSRRRWSATSPVSGCSCAT